MDQNNLLVTDQPLKLYSVNLKPELSRRLDEARGFNRQLDSIDRQHGRPSPSECRLDVELRTVLTALFAGVTSQDWDIVFQGIALLQDAELRIRQGIERNPFLELV